MLNAKNEKKNQDTGSKEERRKKALFTTPRNVILIPVKEKASQLLISYILSSLPVYPDVFNPCLPIQTDKSLQASLSGRSPIPTVLQQLHIHHSINTTKAAQSNKVCSTKKKKKKTNNRKRPQKENGDVLLPSREPLLRASQSLPAFRPALRPSKIPSYNTGIPCPFLYFWWCYRCLGFPCHTNYSWDTGYALFEPLHCGRNRG